MELIRILIITETKNFSRLFICDIIYKNIGVYMANLKCKTIGGITYNFYDINEHHHTDDIYTVKLKDGTLLTYKEQDLAREAEVHIDNNGRIDFKGLFDVKITDTKKNDIYRLMGCEKVILDAANDGGNFDSDLVQVTNRRTSNGIIQFSKNNTLILDKNDLYYLPEDTCISSVENDIESIS